jgi:hypothetical protein
MKKPTLTLLIFCLIAIGLPAQKVITVGKFNITTPTELIGIKKYDSGTIVEYYVEFKNDSLFHYEFWGSNRNGDTVYTSAEIHMCPISAIDKGDFDIEQIIGEDYMYFRASIWTSSIGKPSLKIVTMEYDSDSKKVKKSRDMFISLYAGSKEALVNIKSKLK